MSIAPHVVLDYRVRKPKIPIQDPPVLFLLHGYGSHEDDLFSFADHLPENYLVISLRAPLTLGFGGYAWYTIHFTESQDKWNDNDEAIAVQDLLLHNIDYHLKQFSLGSKKVSLLGFSQGAIISWAVGLGHPDKIDKIIALSGYLNEDIFHYAEKGIEQLRCFSSHGIQDPTIAVEWTRKGVDILRQRAVPLTYKEYAMGHGINPENFSDLLQWLNANP